MAKLTHSNLMAKNGAKRAQVENWDLPIALTPTSAKTQMLPPTSRPQPKIPRTPSQTGQLSSVGSEGHNSSSKKKRRKRGGRRNGDSASEVATTVSGDTAQEVASSARDSSEILVQASQSKLPVLPPNASAEEKRVYENEPEMYGVYASSDEEKEEEQPSIHLTRHERTQTYSPSIVNGTRESSPTRNLPALVPMKTANGRFTCPLEIQYKCNLTFANAKGAKRHADLHINADRFVCEDCDKGFSRKDLFARHVELHRRQADSSRQGTKTPAIIADRKLSNGAAKAKVSDIAKQSERPANMEAVNGNSKADTIVKHTEIERTEPDSDVMNVTDSAHSETDEEANRDTLETKASRRDDPELLAVKHGGLTDKRIPIQTLRSSTERTVISSPSSPRSPAKVQQHIATANTLKRKRVSSQALEEPVSSTSGKRVRRDQGDALRSPEIRGRLMQTSQPKETIINQESTQSKFGAGPTTDVEMEKDEQNEESDQESASGSGNSFAPVSNPTSQYATLGNTASSAAARVYASGTESSDSTAASEAMGEREHDTMMGHKIINNGTGSDQSIRQDSPPSTVGKVFSNKPLPATAHRQSSMDSFVQRSRSTSRSAIASASGSRITVDVPLRSQIQRKNTTQTKLAPQVMRADDAHDDRDSSIDDLSEHELATQSNTMSRSKKKSKATSKGKGRARAPNTQNAAVHGDEDDASSDDRPRATTIARRTTGIGTKTAPKLKSRTILGKKTKKLSDGDTRSKDEKRTSKSIAPKSTTRPTKATSASKITEDEDKSVLDDVPSTANAPWAEASKSGLTGRFTEQEHQALMNWRDSFCQQNDLSEYEFNDMMTSTTAIRRSEWNYSWITKNEFMQQFYNQLPARNRRSMIRFRERHFQNVEKTPWTEADDKELTQLVAENGTKWVDIGQIMGRTQDAVSQRWRHKLNYGDKPALMGDWTSEEVAQLEEEVVGFAELKHTTPDDEDLQIPWVAISKKLGTGRTAQQCSNRWRLNTKKRVNGKFVKVPHFDRIPSSTVKQSRTPSKMEKRLSGEAFRRPGKQYKSAERIEDSDDDEDDGDADDESIDSEDSDVEDDSEDDERRPQATSVQSHHESASHSSGENYRDASEQNVNSEEVEDESMSDGTTSEGPVVKSHPNASQYNQVSSQAEHAMSSQRSSTLEPKIVSTSPTSQPPRSLGVQPQDSSQLSTTKTPPVSKNPFKKTHNNQSTPGQGLSMTQLHAGTQANSSAKRTTGRTDRTRVPDSAFVDDRPSPSISLRRTPVESSSPPSSPLIGTVDASVEDSGDQENSVDDNDMSDGNLEFKSPTSFVSAEDRPDAPQIERHRTTNSRSEDSSAATDEASDSNSATNSTSASQETADSQSESDSEPDRDQNQGAARRLQNEASFWQSVNQNLRKVVGLSQGQNQSQSQDQNRGRKSVLSLTDVLRRGSVAAEDSDSDDEE